MGAYNAFVFKAFSYDEKIEKLSAAIFPSSTLFHYNPRTEIRINPNKYTIWCQCY
jgi:hypothetical protein